MLGRSIRISAIVMAVGLGSAAGAAAEGSPATSAAAGALLMAGKVDDACPKLEESQRLEPATGTLLAIALCHEQQGKLASAWAAFADIEGLSRADGRVDRERTAREHGAALRARLSTLTIVVAAETTDKEGIEEGLTIALDGVAIGRAAWNVAIPIDGGAHVVAATSAGRKPWRASVSVLREKDAVRIAVPPLAPLVDLTPRRPVTPTGASVALVHDAAPGETTRVGHTQRAIGIVLMGVGVVGLATAAVVALSAKNDYDAAVAGCRVDGCPPQPLERARSAQARGNVATFIAAGAGAASIGGVVLWLSAPRDAPAALPASARLGLGPRGLSLSGRF